jgi:hypothetical protein
VLRRQVRALWRLEEDMSPKKREAFSWQLVAAVGKMVYLVGKGGANTFFYKIGENGKLKYVMPDTMLSILDGWCMPSFVSYAIVRRVNGDMKTVRSSLVVKDLLARTQSKYSGCRIVGYAHDGAVTPLYKFKNGLFGSSWVTMK